jgi:hypothetical protein
MTISSKFSILLQAFITLTNSGGNTLLDLSK